MGCDSHTLNGNVSNFSPCTNKRHIDTMKNIDFSTEKSIAKY